MRLKLLAVVAWMLSGLAEALPNYTVGSGPSGAESLPGTLDRLSYVLQGVPVYWLDGTRRVRGERIHGYQRAYTEALDEILTWRGEPSRWDDETVRAIVEITTGALEQNPPVLPVSGYVSRARGVAALSYLESRIRDEYMRLYPLEIHDNPTAAPETSETPLIWDEDDIEEEDYEYEQSDLS